MFDRPVVKDLEFDSLPPRPNSSPPRVFGSLHCYDEDHEYALEKQIYTEEKLNAEQKQIYRYMFDNTTAMVLIPVSYTHLDVYKRQIQRKETFWNNT